MKDYEFISYRAYPDDPYVAAVATVRILKRFVVRYALKKMKNGGSFWGPANISVNAEGEKKHWQGFLCDSRSEEEELTDFIVQQSKLHANGHSQLKTEASVFDAQPKDDQLPF